MTCLRTICKLQAGESPSIIVITEKADVENVAFICTPCTAPSWAPQTSALDVGSGASLRQMLPLET